MSWYVWVFENCYSSILLLNLGNNHLISTKKCDWYTPEKATGLMDILELLCLSSSNSKPLNIGITDRHSTLHYCLFSSWQKRMPQNNYNDFNIVVYLWLLTHWNHYFLEVRGEIWTHKPLGSFWCECTIFICHLLFMH